MVVRPLSCIQKGQRLGNLWRIPYTEITHHSQEEHSSTHTILFPILSQCTTFSKIERIRTYHQIPAHPDDIQKKAIPTTIGLFEFPFMPVGIRNGAKHFQNFEDDILTTWISCKAYIDDRRHPCLQPFPLETRPTFPHPLHPTPKLWKLSERVQVRFPCYQNFFAVLQNLIHVIPAPSRKCRRSSLLPPAKTVCQIRRYLGMLNFCRHFLPRTSSIQALIHGVFSGQKIKAPHSITWTDTTTTAFN